MAPKQAKTKADLDLAAMKTDPYPSLLASATGEYHKGIVNVQGLTISIETPRGSYRSGTDQSGKTWSCLLHNHYGDIVNGPAGTDGDKVDVFLGDDPTAPSAFVIDQVDPLSRAFDEHKVVLGAHSSDEARALYQSNYASGWEGFGSITEMPMDAFKAWLGSHDMRQPVDPLFRNFQPGKDKEGDDPVCPECGACMEWNEGSGSGGTCNRCGSMKAPQIPDRPLDTSDPAADAWDTRNAPRVDEQNSPRWESDVIVMETGQYELLSDGKQPGVVRVRQNAMRADAINLNDRYYPRDVVDAALDAARPRAHAGAMLSEYYHPEVLKKKSGEQVYEDKPLDKTARVDDCSRVGEDGWVTIDRTILSTDAGQDVADRLQQKRPLGLSTRFKMKGHVATIDGRRVHVADFIEIHTWDDVPNPAFADAGKDFQLLTDNQRSQLGLLETTTDRESETSRLTEAAASDKASDWLGLRNDEATQPRAPKGLTHAMNPKLKATINTLFALIAAKAPSLQVRDARKALTDEITLANRNSEDVIEASTLAMRADDLMSQAGYRSDAPAPWEVDGGATGTNAGGGYGEDVGAGARETVAKPQDTMFEEQKKRLGLDGISPEDLAYVKTLRTEKVKAAADAERMKAITAACDSERVTTLKQLSSDDQDYLLSIVSLTALDAGCVPQLVADHLEKFMQRLSKERLRGGGYDPARSTRGNSVDDPASGTGRNVEVREMHPVFDEVFKDKGSAPAHLAEVARLCAASDDYIRTANVAGAENPDTAQTQQRRAHNLKIILPLLDDVAKRFHGVQNANEWFARADALSSGGEGAFADAIAGGTADQLGLQSDAVLTGNLFNQPTILTAILVQKLWDSKMLQFVQAFGPGVASPGGSGWAEQVMPGGSMGSAFRLPVEYRDYGNMSGYAAQPLAQYDPGYLVPENTGADEVRFALRWLSYAASLRSIALQITRETILGLGHGPLNYNAFGRGIWHMGHDLQLRMDKAMADEMIQIADEYGAIAVSAELCTFANNSVYNAAGSILVNLNPAKTAIAGVAAGDASVLYGANVVAIVRLVSAGSAGAAPFFGSVAGSVPICRPRTNYDLSAPGQLTSAVQNPVTVTQAGGGYAAPVRGYIDGTGQVATFPGGGPAANFAVDWINGAVLFTAGYTAYVNNAGVIANAAGSTTAFAYAYVTNYDNFQVNNVTLGTGITLEMYLNGLLGQIDQTAARMGQQPRYVKPDLVLCSEVASTFITRAQAFWQWASPKGTELFPTPDYYARRNELNMARTNVPWIAGDQRLNLTRTGTTKYAIEEPFTTRGPQFASDSNGKPIQREAVLGYERSAVFTPQVTDQAGNILNPVSRTIILR